MTFGWPDLLVLAVLALGAFKGFRAGLILELAGAAALVCALIAPWTYRGGLDPFFSGLLRTGDATAHVIVMLLIGIFTYVAVILFAHALTAFARLPVIGLGNALAGAVIGAAKAAVGVWIVLYLALFFPLSPEVRIDLHRSMSVRAIASANERIDAAFTGTLPPFLRPIVQPFFDRHRV